MMINYTLILAGSNDESIRRWFDGISKKLSHQDLSSLVLVIPTIISATLLGLSLSNTYISNLKTLVSSNRAPIQVVVQVLSLLMGACQIYAHSVSISFRTVGLCAIPRSWYSLRRGPDVARPGGCTASRGAR